MTYFESLKADDHNEYGGKHHYGQEQDDGRDGQNEMLARETRNASIVEENLFKMLKICFGF